MGKLPEWVKVFPELDHIDSPVWVEVATRAKKVELPAGTEVFREGSECRNYIFMLKGTVRVYKGFESGREMVLYRLYQGETCSLTTSLLLSGGEYSASALTEEDTLAVLVPANDFHRAFDASRVFRSYVCRVFSGRIRDMIMLLEAVTMRNVNIRLARWLLEHRSASNSVEASHRELAYELGTAREVISRHLRDFEKHGWVNLSRKSIELQDLTALQDLLTGSR